MEISVSCHTLKINANKYDNDGWPEHNQTARVARGNPSWTGHHSIARHTHTDTHTVDTQVHLTASQRHGAGRGNMQISHRHWPQPGIFYFFISITMKQHWPEQCHWRTCSIGYIVHSLCRGHFFTSGSCWSLMGPGQNSACRCADHQECLGEGLKFLWLAD